jgi:hypothetical protein
MINETPLIFVYIGKRIPRYAYHSLNFAVENSGLKVILISDAKPKQKLNKAIEHVRYVSNEEKPDDLSSNQFRDGFWIKTTERFYAIQQFLMSSKMKSFFHAELDNLVFDISDVSSKLDKIGNGIFVPRINEEHAIASLIYVNSTAVFNEFCQFSRMFRYSCNDMEILSDFLDQNKGSSFSLPCDPASSASKKLGSDQIPPSIVGLFDAAAIGQWYFGTDPRNSYTTVNNLFENYRHSGLLQDYKIERKLLPSTIMISSKTASFPEMKLNNLHVHSKITRRLSSRKNLDQIIRRTNAGRSSLISLNLLGRYRWVRDVLIAVRNRLL